MDTKKLLRKICRGSQSALGEIIRAYSAYVVTVIENRGRGFLTPEDAEEVAADVFYALWQHADQVENLKSWLSGVARNKTVDMLRRKKPTVPLEEGTGDAGEDALWDTLLKKEQARQVREAVGRLRPQDQEIFHRYYDLCQTTEMISRDMALNPSTVRTRLSRGRMVLRETLCQGGAICDAKEN